jgi:hypothetical protein
VREQQRPAAHSRAGQGGLGAGVSTTDDDHVKARRKQHDFIGLLL